MSDNLRNKEHIDAEIYLEDTSPKKGEEGYRKTKDLVPNENGLTKDKGSSWKFSKVWMIISAVILVIIITLTIVLATYPWPPKP